MRIAKPAESDLDKADHTVYGLQKVRDAGFKTLRSYAGTVSSVGIAWNLNEATERDAVFKIKLGDEVAYLSKEEVIRCLRWV
jgi:hypothetical protein